MSAFGSDVAHVHAADVLAAQKLLNGAIETAQAQWLPLDAIAYALAL